MNDDSSRLILAVDGGGTGCRARLTDIHGNIIAEAKGGSANIKSNPDGAFKNLADLYATTKLKASEEAVIYAHFGLAGVVDAVRAEHTADALKRELGLKYCSVSDDRLTSLEGAIGGGDGAVFAIGTGSFVAANRGGEIHLVGGWGAILGDQGAGAWLGKKLLGICMLAEDGIHVHSSLTQDIIAGFNGSPDQIVDFATNASAADFAAFAPRVADSADDGDPVAAELMRSGAEWITAALSASGHKPGSRIAPLGGLGHRYVKYLSRDLRQDICPAKGNALDGAFRLACKAFVPEAL